MLGSVAFDGFSQTDYWAVEVRAKLTREVIERSPTLADVVGGLVALTGLLLMVGFVALAYIVAMRIAARAVHYDGDLTDAFLGSLVPIALAYVVAHYFSFLVRESQYLAIYVSDPFGFGWDLFGTADVTPRINGPRAADDLVRPGGGARHRPRRRARPRPRQGGRALRVTAQGGHQPVRHAGADGRLHRRRALAAVALAGQLYDCRAASQRGSSQRILSGLTPRFSASARVSSWKRTMSTTGCSVGTSVVSRADLAERAHDVRGPLGRAALALEDEDPDGLVDGGEVAVEDLLGVVRLGGEADALAQLQHRLLGGRPVAAGADDGDALAVEELRAAPPQARARPRPAAR